MDIVEKIRELAIEVEEVRNRPVETLGQITHIPGDMCYATFVAKADFLKDLKGNIGMIITTKEIAEEVGEESYGLAIVDDPTVTFFKLHNYLQKGEEYGRKKFPSRIAASASISTSAHIAENNVVIEDDVIIEENVVIRENTHIGKGSIIRAGVIVGGEGFEFKREADSIMRIGHGGGVVIGENVEIQYNSCIDKGLYPWDDTVLEDFVKIDDMVYVAHGAKIGKAVMIASHGTVGGRVKIGEKTWIGFNVAIRNGIEVGKECRANMGAVVTKNVPDGAAVSGNFAIDHKTFIDRIKNS